MQAVVYLLIWGLLFMFLMRLGCGVHVMGHRPAQSRKNGNDALSRPPEKAIDPVCGMKVDTATAKSSVHDGQIQYFCSQDCREKFEAAPQLYLKGASARGATQGMEHSHG